MAATVFQTIYGYKVESDDDVFVLGAQETVINFCKAQMPGNFLANFFPALFHIPDWMPFTEWKRTARKWRERKDWIAKGTAEHSMIGSLLDSKLTEGWDETEKDDRLKTLGITLYAGGTDTVSVIADRVSHVKLIEICLVKTASALTSFIAAMVLFPDVQAKAQAEIDHVIGLERLPAIADRDRLPYVNRLILEVLRWQPVIPIGVPHLSSEDDEYMGYRIPKGTMMFMLRIGNIWAMSRNEAAYPDPETFNPDRYLDPSVPIVPSFGWGRRKCPGTHYAEASMFIAVSSMLAAFRFFKATDVNGNEVTPVIENDLNSAIV
ncbi:cytochrome P450 family protein [Ceratobasidium sp. AG-Ba]|nr:cytochrome P450 family protein [Ceratobasidium sp. AG-Ba]QRW11720.1 cytochrome P450 family protein [Ceratobasidium sp. AG-Ba]